MLYEIKAYRLAYNLTQAQMGEMLGLSKSAISMIEIGKRPMPDAAKSKLIKLQKEISGLNGKPAQIIQEDYFSDIRSNHRKDSGDYIETYCGDLRSEIHRLSKLVKVWTAKFNTAGQKLVMHQFVLQGMAAQNIPASVYDGTLKKMALENQLKEVLKQKPELAIIRIEGLKKELEVAKKMLGKQNRFPVVDEVTNYIRLASKTEALPVAIDIPVLPDVNEQL